jgi:alpha-tubulin suppressor-like RCC1 family protein
MKKGMMVWILLTLLLGYPAISQAVLSLDEKAEVVKISGGEEHTLVVTADGYAWACGNDTFWQLGIGGQGQGYETILVPVWGAGGQGTFLGGIDEISAGWQHSLALDVDETVWAWGTDYKGQLGNGTDGDSSIPAKVKGEGGVGNLSYIKAIAAGRSGEHSLAVGNLSDISQERHVWAWGRNEDGQLGNNKSGPFEKEQLPVKVHAGQQDPLYDPINNIIFLEDIDSVSAGTDHSMALDIDGTVYTWGNNTYSKLGHTNLPITVSGKVLSGEQSAVDTYLKDIVAISAGWDHSMALEEIDPQNGRYGRVFTWGFNGPGYYYADGSDGGRLGDGTTTDSDTPVIVVWDDDGDGDPTDLVELKNIVKISAGESHCMALDEDGYIWTWGDNMFGQLGTGTTVSSSIAVKVVARDTDGDGNPDDLNGNGDFTDDFLDLGDNIDEIDISAGYWHCTAIDENGTLWTWGASESGKAGLGDRKKYDAETLNNVTIPDPVGVVKNITQQTFCFGLQKAIDAASDGDTLVASEAPYYEAITIPDTFNLTIESQLPLLKYADRTVIDGSYSYFGVIGVTAKYGSIKLNGLTVRRFYTHNVYLLENSSSSEIMNCIITDDGSDDYDDPSIFSYGILDTTSGVHGAKVHNCIIYGNHDHGIWLRDTEAEIKNNWIYDNGGYGIHVRNFDEEEKVPLIRNNTVVDNEWYGIIGTFASSTAVNNNILWENNSGGTQLFGVSGTDFSFIQHVDTGNPGFVDYGSDDFHLEFGSVCIDAGAPPASSYAGEEDIDNGPRVVGLIGSTPTVDIGADEASCSDDSYPECWNYPTQCHADADGDGDVDTVDWSQYRDGYTKSYPDQAYIDNACADYNHDGTIDNSDWPEFRDWFNQIPGPPADCPVCP